MEIFDKWEKFGAIFDYDLLNFAKLYIWFHFRHHQCMRKKTKESRRQITACLSPQVKGHKKSNPVLF